MKEVPSHGSRHKKAVKYLAEKTSSHKLCNGAVGREFNADNELLICIK